MEAHLICNNCGGRYQTIETDSPDDTTTLPDKKSSTVGYKNKLEIRYYRHQCPVCGAVKPKISYNEENELTYRAFQLLAESKFDEADAAFDEVLAKYPENVEAYWGKVKAKYRVIYKENDKGKMVPTCEKTKHRSVFKDENYQKAYEYADERIKAFLKKQANEIDWVRGIKQKKALKILTPIFLLAVIGIVIGPLFRPSKLSYEVNADDMTCTITGIGACKDTDIRIPETIDGYKVTRIGNFAFRNCTSVTSIVIPDSVTSIGSSTFKGCTSLESVVIPEGVTSIGDSAFEDCTSLTSIIIPDSVTSIGDSAFEDCTSLTSIIIPDSVTSIGDSAFQDCTSLESVVIPEGLTSIGKEAFYNCKSLTSIEIPDGVTSIGYAAFGGCTRLTSVELPNGLARIGDYAFRDCTSLTSIKLPDSVTSIGHSAFFCCTKLTEIAVSDGNPYYCAPEGVLFNKNGTELICYPAGKTESAYTIFYGVTRIGDYAFRDCTSLTSIVIPDSVTSIGNYAFRDCTSLTSIEIPDSVMRIGDYAFRDCTSLTSIVIPDSVTSIGNRAFAGCKNLTSIIIPDSVTSIGDSAFQDCTSLESVVIPEGLTSIGSYAFYDCEKLTEIRYNGTTAQWQKISKGVLVDYNTGEYKVYCTDGTLSKS